jgi:hypothetical protein
MIPGSFQSQFPASYDVVSTDVLGPSWLPFDLTVTVLYNHAYGDSRIEMITGSLQCLFPVICDAVPIDNVLNPFQLHFRFTVAPACNSQREMVPESLQCKSLAIQPKHQKGVVTELHDDSSGPVTELFEISKTTSS